MELEFESRFVGFHQNVFPEEFKITFNQPVTLTGVKDGSPFSLSLETRVEPGQREIYLFAKLYPFVFRIRICQGTYLRGDIRVRTGKREYYLIYILSSPDNTMDHEFKIDTLKTCVKYWNELDE
jgi:hypothetical protein